MKTIRLEKVKPNVFSESDVSNSEIWYKDVCFETSKFYLVSAHSGKGKSSLCDYLFCRRTDYSGDIFLDEICAKKIKAKQKSEIRKNELSIVFQGFRMFPELTAMENIQIKNRLTNHKKDDEIEAMFANLGISNKIDKPLGILSFGQQQRVAIIRALCQPFNFLMIDEAFSHLDDENSKIACNLIADEVRRQNASLIVASLGSEYYFDYDKKLLL